MGTPGRSPEGAAGEDPGHGWSRVHRLTRGGQAAGGGPRAADLRPPCLPLPLTGGGRAGRRRRDRQGSAAAGGPRPRRRHPPRCGRKRGRCRGEAGSRAALQCARNPGGPRGRSRSRATASALRQHDLGLQRLCGPPGRRGHATGDAEPPLHGHQAGRRALLQGVSRAVRSRVHHPQVRDSLRAPGARGDRDRGAHGQGRERRAADHRRCRQASPGASCTSRTSPREWLPRCAQRRRTASTTWPATRRSRFSRSPRRCGARIRDTGIVHTPARSADFDGRHVSSERAARELDWTAKTPFADGFRRYLVWRRVRNHPRRVLILSADIGEGHDLPARALATGLRTESPGVEVRVVDGLRAMGRLMTLLIRDGSWLSFNWLPWLFEAQYFLLARFPPTRWLALKLGYLLCGRRLRKAIRTDDPDVVVSTYPGTTAVLGELRRLGAASRSRSSPRSPT